FVRINQTATDSNPWSIQEMNVNGQGLSRSGWIAIGTPTSPTDVAGNAIDGTGTTRWNTVGTQASGQAFQVDMGSAQTFNQISLDAGTSTTNYPRDFSVF